MNIDQLSKKQLANMFDHTCLKAFASQQDFDQLCEEAKDNGFKMIAINSAPVAYCKSILKDTPVHVGAAIGFPLGQTTIAVKCVETQDAIDHGADEIDYVINVGEVKNGNFDYIEAEMMQIVKICRSAGVLCKVIFENCYLEENEIRKVAQLAKKVKPDFIKTSTGFGTGGATVADIKIMKEEVGDSIKIKAAGGIRDWLVCKQMIEAGAERIGTSSSFNILAGFCQEKGIS